MDFHETETFDLSRTIHYNFLIEKANEYENTMFDLTLSVENREIQCHKALLCEESEYFSVMLTIDMKERDQDVISLKDVNYIAVKSVIDFLYTCKLAVPANEMCDIIRIVDMFQIQILRPVCAEILINSLSISNIISIYGLASQCHYYDVVDEAYGLILKHFYEVCRGLDFMELSYETVLKIFSSNFLCCPDEDKFVHTILKWIQYDVNSRHVHLIDLLETVKPRKITGWHSLRGTASMFGGFPEFSKFKDWIKDKEQGSGYLHVLGRKRGSKDYRICVAVGGMRQEFDSPMKHAEIYLQNLGPNMSGWSLMIPYSMRTSSAVEAMNGAYSFPAVAARDRFLYIIGGENECGEMDCFEFYDLMNNTWVELPKLPFGFILGAAVCSERRIYVSGGYHEIHPGNFMPEKIMDKVWFLDTDENGYGKSYGWQEGPSMQHPRSAHALVNVNGFLYAIGGVGRNGKQLASVECLVPGKSRWIEMPSLSTARSHFACAVFEKKIFVMGGENDQGCLSSVEVLDTELATSWQFREDMGQSRTKCAASVMRNRIFLAGGHNEIQVFETVTMYNPENDKWHMSDNMKFKRLGLGLATLKFYYDIAM